MLNHKKTRLPLAIAVAFGLAAPAAFAQDTGVGAGTDSTARVAPAAASVPSQTHATAAVQADPQAATPAVPAAPVTQAKKSWSELDANGNGSLSASEAASIESLSKVFAKADADANGELTQEEYKAWLAASGKASDKTHHGG